MTRDNLQFLRRGRTVSFDRFQSRSTVLDWLRLQERSPGLKKAARKAIAVPAPWSLRVSATVALVRAGQFVHHLLGQLDGTELITVEDLAEDGRLHRCKVRWRASTVRNAGSALPAS